MAATPEHAARVLGLGLDATLEDVRLVRRKLALKYHPDRSADLERSTRHMARINAAADTLIAFLKNKAASRPAGQAASQAHRAARSSARSEKAAPKTDRKEAGARSQQEASRQHRKTASAGAERKPQNRRTRSKAELARILLATESYGKVLERIGGQYRGPRMDVRVMSFAQAG